MYVKKYDMYKNINFTRREGKEDKSVMRKSECK